MTSTSHDPLDFPPVNRLPTLSQRAVFSDWFLIVANGFFLLALVLMALMLCEIILFVQDPDASPLELRTSFYVLTGVGLATISAMMRAVRIFKLHNLIRRALGNERYLTRISAWSTPWPLRSNLTWDIVGKDLLTALSNNDVDAQKSAVACISVFREAASDSVIENLLPLAQSEDEHLRAETMWAIRRLRACRLPKRTTNKENN